MRVLLLSNAASGSSDPAVIESISAELSALGPVTSLAPDSLESFDQEVSEAAAEADLLVVAGGDGTLNCTVNALRGQTLHELSLALIPLGTGNDFARTLGLPPKSLDAARAVLAGSERAIDVWRAKSDGVDRLFVNACIGGFPVEVDETVDEDLKRKLGPVAFIAGGAKAAANMTRYRVRISDTGLDDCIAAGVGNGQTCGGGVRMWPQADPSDGLLDACLLSAEGAGDTLKLAATVRSGRHVQLDAVETGRRDRIEITSDPPMEFNLDGELVGLISPVSFERAGSIRIRA
jgi:diacylglycerol kinase (ATP)